MTRTGSERRGKVILIDTQVFELSPGERMFALHNQARVLEALAKTFRYEADRLYEEEKKREQLADRMIKNGLAKMEEK